MHRIAAFSAFMMIALTGQAAAPPVSAFAALPEISAVKLSPDGRKLLIMRAIEETHHPVVLDMESGKSNLVMAANPEEFLFNWCDWASDRRIICSIRRYDTLQASQIDASRYRYYRDGRTTFTRMLAVDSDGGNVLQLIKAPVNRGSGDIKWNPVDQDNIRSWLPDDPDHVIVALAREERTRPSVYRLNIHNNRLTRIRRYHDSVYDWHVDRKGVVRFATGFRNTTPVAFSVENKQIREIDLSALSADNALLLPNVIGLSGDGSKIYFSSYHEGGHRSLYQADATTGANIEPLFRDPEFDVFGSLLSHPDTASLQLLHYLRDDVATHWFDKSLEAKLADAHLALQKTYTRVKVIDFDRSQNRFVFEAEGPTSPPGYYLYDHTEQSMRLIGITYPDLTELVESKTIRYPARDGYQIPAILTVPGGTGPHPTILYPHGGPNLRDTPHFDYWTQYFVSRGYAVLQPNFRGSTGYGAEHLAAGFEQWGLRMQQDVMDGLDWLVKQNITDPGRVCVVGGSYGGYVALVAAFKTPNLIRCAVSFAGVTDLAGLKERVNYFDLGELALARIQSGVAMDANSPLRRVDDIGVPLLIVHGDMDRSVMIEQSRDFVSALEKAGKTYTYIEQTDGDHFLSIARHRLQLFQAMDEFLVRYLH